jgi:cation:H+ antiporter
MDHPFASAVLLIVSLFLLWQGADLVVHAAARIAHRFCLPDLVIGMTVVALGTSAPEIAVTLLAAIKAQPDIALGNVVGSNVFNMGLILGTTALLRACPIPRLLVRRDAPMLLIATILLLICVSDRSLDRWEGLLMEALFLLYLIYLFRRDHGPIDEQEIPMGTATVWDVPILILGLCALIGGGHLLVDSASSLAQAVGVSDWAIAVTIVAAGTSAPECATCIVAVLRGRHSMATGNLIGSDLFNILGVLGLASILRPLSVSAIAPGSVILMVAMVATVLIFMRSGWRLSRAEGLALIAFSLMRWSRDIAPGVWPGLGN